VRIIKSRSIPVILVHLEVKDTKELKETKRVNTVSLGQTFNGLNVGRFPETFRKLSMETFRRAEMVEK